MNQDPTVAHKWWKEGIIYQIYPQSFYDSNGDGIGDLRGIIQKLDYIKSLGVDIIWLNPVYESPLDDNGYDISNYRAINPIYGTMDDFDEMLEEMHNRGLKLLMDLVVNHSSDEHKWFKESRKSKDNLYRDYYFWRPGKNGGPPNNWPSIFGGSVWEFDGITNEYYLHYFSRKQPDLNWENPMVRQEVTDIVRWWLDKGIDGFRLDVISMISKYLDFPEAHGANFGDMFTQFFCNGPRVHEFIHELYVKSFKDYDAVTVGEGPGISKELGNDYTGQNREELNMIFPLELMFSDWGPDGRFDPGSLDRRDIKSYFREWNNGLGDEGWMSVFLDNHDFPRMVSRFGNDTLYRAESAKLLLTMLLTLRGTPSIHYGSEIGMTNNPLPSIDQYRDIESRNFYREAVRSGMTDVEAMRRIQKSGRDNVRTPMQWDSSKHGGFTTGTPWLESNPNHSYLNVEEEESNGDGILAFFRQLTAFRKANKTLSYGSFNELDPEHPYVFYYERKDTSAQFAVVLNMSDHTFQYQIDQSLMQLLICNYPDEGVVEKLRPWEARVYSKAV